MSQHDENMKKWRQRAKSIVKLYETNEYSFADLGRKYAISAERVRQIYLRAKS